MNERWEIVYYQSPNQTTSPVSDFINSLSPDAKSKVIVVVDLLETYGTKVGLPHSKKLVGTALWELRILGRDSIRILYITAVGKKFLMLHGFIKKKQKTEKKEIKTALTRLLEYNSRAK